MAGPDGEYKRDPTYVGENAWATETNESVEQVVAAGNLNDEEKAELLEFLNEGRAEKGLPLYNSEFKVEGSDDDSALANSNDLTAGQFLSWTYESVMASRLLFHSRSFIPVASLNQ